MNETNRIDSLEAEVRRLSEQLSNAQKNLTQIQRELVQLRTGQPTEQVTVVEIHTPISPTIAPPIPAPAKPVFTKQSAEEFIGGNLLSKVGIAALVIGLAIFVKFAFDNELLGPWGRLAVGWGIGGVLIGLAYYLKRQYLTYSAVLLSGGVATGYFTTYAAYYFYHFLPTPVAFGIMVIATVFTVWEATRYEVEWIGLFGLAGAYAVPFLVGGNGAPWGMFVYMTILNGGVLWLSFLRDWRLMNLAAFWTTWIIFIAFIITRRDLASFHWTSLCFGSVFFLLMYANQLAFPVLRKTSSWSVVLLVFNAIFYFVSETVVLDERYTTLTLTLFSLLNAAIHGAVTWFLYQRGLKDTPPYQTTFSLMLCFLIIAVPIQLEANWVMVVWTTGAYILYRLSRIQNDRVLRIFSVLLILLAGMAYLFRLYDYPITTPRIPFLNTNFLINILYLSALSAMITYEVKGTKPGRMAEFLFILLAGSGFLMGWMEWYQYLTIDKDTALTIANRKAAFTIFTAAYLGVLSYVAARIGSVSWKLVGLLACALFAGYLLFTDPLSELRKAYLPTQQSMLLWRYGIYASIGVLLAGVYPFIQMTTVKLIRDWLLVAVHLVILWMLSQELLTLFVLSDPAHQVQEISRATHAGWSILWGIYSLILIGVGFGKKIKRYRLFGIALFGIVILKILVYDLINLSTGGKIAIFLSVGVLLLITSFLYQRFKDKILED